MAKISSIAKNNKRKKMSYTSESKRAELRDQISSPELSTSDRLVLQRKLQKMPRDTSRIRVRNRCALTGRSRGYYRDFGLSRIKFRELAHQGLIPGITKASW